MKAIQVFRAYSSDSLPSPLGDEVIEQQEVRPKHVMKAQSRLRPVRIVLANQFPPAVVLLLESRS
jgi:hypothetical protein